MFTSNKLLVVVAELRGEERDALDMVPVVTTALLEEHQLVTGIVVIVDPGERHLLHPAKAGFATCRIALSHRAAKIEMDSILATRRHGMARWGNATHCEPTLALLRAVTTLCCVRQSFMHLLMYTTGPRNLQ